MINTETIPSFYELRKYHEMKLAELEKKISDLEVSLWNLQEMIATQKNRDFGYVNGILEGILYNIEHDANKGENHV